MVPDPGPDEAWAGWHPRIHGSAPEASPRKPHHLALRRFCLGIAMGLAGLCSAHGQDGWNAIPGGRWRSAVAPTASGPRAGFTLVPAAQTGIAFTNHLSEASAANNRILENGSGVALGDVNGDGLCDIYFCRLEGDNVLYLNRGDWRFEDATAAGGVACPGQASTGTALVDTDGDGDLDLLVNSIGGGTRLFSNDGSGRFTEVTGTRLARRFGATSLALSDMDGDGDLDLYVTNYRTDTFRDEPAGLRVEATRQADGSISVKPEGRFIPLLPRGGGVEVLERGERDFLYLNQGGGNFAPVGWTTGAFVDEDGATLKDTPTDWGLAVQFRDFTGDGLPDLYVCNDFVYWPDRIWINDGGRRFRAAPRLWFRHQSLSSMSVDVADIDRDGRDDLFVADMMSRSAERRAWQRPNVLAGVVSFPRLDPQFRPEVTHNTLQLARDDGSFAEIAAFAGVAATEWTWSAAFQDVDLDGWEDLLLATGNFHDVQHADVLAELAQSRGPSGPATRLRNLQKFGALPNPLLAYRNRRDRTFEDASAAWNFQLSGIHTGMAFADLDNDGDADSVLSHLNGPATILRNEATAPRIAVRLRGQAPNTQGIGARIRVTGGPVAQAQEVIAGGRYLSSDDTLRIFAAGKADASLAIEITWRSGRTTLVPDAKPGRIYEIQEPATPAPAAPPSSRPPPPGPPWFAAITLPASPAAAPAEDPPSAQRLLPRRVPGHAPVVGLIRAGTNTAESLLVGAGPGTSPRWMSGGPANAASVAAPGGAPPPMASTVAALSDGSDDGWLLIGSADASRIAPPVIHAGERWKGLAAAIPPMNPGAAAAADLDGDGRLELFVGDRGVPGQWPRGTNSYLLKGGPAGWTVAQVFKDIGPVTGALFTDLDDDGVPELVVTSQPGEVRVWGRTADGLKPRAFPGLGGQTGWWTCIAAADIDADGRMDLLTGNWGWNWRPEPRDPTSPDARIAWADFSGAGSVEPLLAAWEPSQRRWFVRREWKAVSAILPWIPVAFPNHAAYGKATFEEVLAGKPGEVDLMDVRTSASMAWLNRGDRFEAHPLPAEAQWSPANAIGCGDFDGDGAVDLFLAQNEFGVDEESTRQDAGTGLVLRGDGRGGFRPLGPAEAGVFVAGEGRGIAVGDIDRDGRPDLLHAVHRQPAQAFRNVLGRPGTRVEPARGVSPARWIGTQVRWRKDTLAGPVQEVRAGNGHGSQDGLALLVTGAPDGAELEVRFPHAPSRRQPLRHPVTVVEP